MRPPARTAVAIATTALAAAASGCGTTVDPRSGEALIRHLVAVTPSLGTVRSVSCPAGVKPKTGAAFACRVSVLDRGRPVSGTVTVHIVAGQKVAILSRRDLSSSLLQAAGA